MLKMISLSRFLAAATLLLLSTGLMRGQTMTTNFVPANITAPVGQTVDIQLKVTGFTNILTFQFPITFNPTVLQFQSADGFGLPGMGQANVSYQATPTAKIGLSYEAHPINFPTGVTVAAGTSILTLHFKVIGDGTTSVNISNQSGLQPVIDIVKDPGDAVTLNFQSGGSMVKGGNGTVALTGFKMIAGTKLGLEPDSANVGQNICIPVKVNDFDAIESMQFAMHFDKNKLAYTGVQNFGLDGLDATQIIVNAGTGLVTVGWSDPGELVNGQYVIDGVTLPDLKTIFEMCFNAVGTGGTTTDITIDGIGISGGAEAINHNGQQVWKADTPVNGKVFFKNAPDPNAIKIWIDTATVLQNEIKCVDVKVANFTSMDQVQLGIVYDATKLEFVNATGIPGPLTLGIGSTITFPPPLGSNTPGQIKLAWYDVSPTGIGTTLPDGSAIFTLCFKGIGAVNSTNKIEIKEIPGPNGTSFIIEIFKNGSSVPVNPNLTNGHLYITDKPPCSASVQLTTQTNPKCFNGSDGAIDITANGTGTLSYNWAGPTSFSASTADISSLKPGTYIGTVTSTAGCSATISVTLVNPQQITASGTGTGVTCFGGSNGSIDLTAGGGTGTLTYSWSGPSSPGAVQDPFNLAAGNYICTVKDGNDCTLSTSPILVPTPGPIVFQNIATVQPTCFNSNNGSVSLEASGGTPPFTYSWSGPNIPGATTNSSITNLGAGVFQVTATDSKACPKTSQTFAMQPPSELKVNVDAVGNVKCFDDVNGSISITPTGGTPGYSFEWKNSAGSTVNVTEDPAGLPAGVYSVVVKDNKNCTATTTSVTIASPSSALTVAAPTTKNITCPGGSDGSINLSANGGWGTPNVAWTPATVQPIFNPTNLPAGNYSATITDSQGCTKTQTATITAPQDFALTNTTVNHLKCHNSADGSISINVTGGTAPLNVVWNPGALTGTTISTLGAGVYTPSITDSKQCTKTFPAITVNAPTQVVADQQIVNDADGVANGSITVEISGGTKPYNYKWSVAAPDSKTLSAPAGTYTVTVTDANGCILVLTNVIGQKSVAFAPLFDSSAATCFGETNGCLTVNLNTTHAAHLPVKIDWQGGTITTSDLNAEICGLAGGVYNLTLTAATGQVAVLSNLNVIQQPLVQHQINTKNPNQDFKNGEIKLNPIWTSANYSYEWEWFEKGVLKTATTKDLIYLDSGTYCVTITNIVTLCKINFCERLDRVWQPIVASAPEVEVPTCLYSCNGQIRVSYSGGNPPFRYKWTSSTGVALPDTNKVVNLCPGIYNLTVTDGEGTTATGSWNLKPKSTLAATATVTPGPNGYDVSGPKECDGEVKIATTGQFGAVNYQWSNTTITATNSSLCKGAWWAIVTDAAGCADTLNGNLTAPPAVVFGVNISNYNGFNVRCAGGSDGEAAVTVSGGVPPYQVAWSTGFTQTINTAAGITHQKALAAGTYTLTVTDANDVQSVDTLVLTEPEGFVINLVETVPSRFTQCDGKFEINSNGAEPVAYTWTSQINSGSTDEIGELCSNEAVSVLAIDANGCRATVAQRMGYAIDGCLIFRPVLTPGQTEDKNDDLLVTCIESVPENTLEIYNRWGQIVYQTDAYDNGSKVWKGTTSKGLPLPEGVYYYILTYKNSRDEQQQVKGYVNLLR